MRIVFEHVSAATASAFLSVHSARQQDRPAVLEATEGVTITSEDSGGFTVVLYQNGDTDGGGIETLVNFLIEVDERITGSGEEEKEDEGTAEEEHEEAIVVETSEEKAAEDEDEEEQPVDTTAAAPVATPAPTPRPRPLPKRPGQVGGKKS